MSVNTLEITREELKHIVDEMIDERLAGFFHDLDDEAEFTDELKVILHRQDERIASGERGELLSDIAARLGLN
ncbi:hypothetical protein BH10ACI2_BH10ACI2_17880 [soil metagenome]